MNLSNYSFQKRLDIMLGAGATPFIWACRACWLAFACYTASDPSATYYIAPHQWAIGVLLYYFYPV